MTRTFDLICLGTGPAASTVAITCAKQGDKVAVVESRELGGTCALRGCNPKKVFTNAASLLDQFQRATGKLTRGDDARIDWSDLVAFQHEFTDPVPQLTEDKLRKLGIETVQGVAQFESERVIRVGESLLEAENIFIGVGARPVPLKIPGEELVVTSDDFMELRSLPPEILFLGGGFISFEFANVAVRADSKRLCLESGSDPLPLDSGIELTHCGQGSDSLLRPSGPSSPLKKGSDPLRASTFQANNDALQRVSPEWHCCAARLEFTSKSMHIPMMGDDELIRYEHLD